jgi:hypothetical protein
MTPYPEMVEQPARMEVEAQEGLAAVAGGHIIGRQPPPNTTVITTEKCGHAP